MQDTQERLMELYEKGALTKEETKACYLELGMQADALFLAEETQKSRFGFTLPSFKVFSSTKLKQEFQFEDVTAMSIRLTKGRVSFVKHKKPYILVQVTYPTGAGEELPQIYVEMGRLRFDSYLPCQLTVSFPEQMLSVLELDMGRADVRLDYVPFEDICIRSQMDDKQQELRLTPLSGYNQHLLCQLREVPLTLFLGKQQGIKGKLTSSKGRLRVNRKEHASPCFCEKTGETFLYLQVETQSSPIILKGVRDASRMVSSKTR